MCFIHIVEYYLFIKSNYLLRNATTSIKLGNIKLKGKKPVNKEHILHDFFYMKYIEKENLHVEKVD